MKITVCVHDPDGVRAPKFVAAALAAGHEIPLVFFYHDGVRAAARGGSSSQAELWRRLHRDHQIPLAVCIGAASRRQLASESDRRRVDKHFDVVGLGQLMGALMDSDRVVTFTA